MADAIGASARFEPLDVTDEENWAAVVAATTRNFGKLDVLVNNAGISGSAEQDFYSTEAWHRIMAVNATGVFFGIKYAIPAMVANGGGSIVNLSSIAGIIGSEHVHMAYNASKAAVRLMTKSVAVQHAKDNIRANSVHPGIMPPMRTSGRTADPAVRAERMRIVPMRRPGEVDEVAHAILFLASDESSYITGSEIHAARGCAGAVCAGHRHGRRHRRHGACQPSAAQAENGCAGKAAGAAGMAGAIKDAVRPLKRPPGEYDLTLRQADQARSDFAAIADDLEFIMARLAKVPARRDLEWVALTAFVGGAILATFVNLVLWR